MIHEEIYRIEIVAFDTFGNCMCANSKIIIPGVDKILETYSLLFKILRKRANKDLQSMPIPWFIESELMNNDEFKESFNQLLLPIESFIS